MCVPNINFQRAATKIDDFMLYNLTMVIKFTFARSYNFVSGTYSIWKFSLSSIIRTRRWCWCFCCHCYSCSFQEKLQETLLNDTQHRHDKSIQQQQTGFTVNKKNIELQFRPEISMEIAQCQVRVVSSSTEKRKVYCKKWIFIKGFNLATQLSVTWTDSFARGLCSLYDDLKQLGPWPERASCLRVCCESF